MKLLMILSVFASAPVFASYVITLPSGIDGDSRPLVQDVKNCRTEVDDVISWGDEENQKQAIALCELRKQHQTLKADFVKKLQHMVDATADWTNHGMNSAYQNTAKAALNVLSECINSSEAMIYPHNIAILTTPESVRIECYAWALTLPSIRNPEE